MNDKQKAFQQKVKNRKFAMDHSWRADIQTQNKTDNVPAREEQHAWNNLEENLAAANLHKQWDPFFPIRTQKRRIGRIVIFVKRVIRKMLHVVLGWYLLPMYDQQNKFNGKVLNVVSLERELIVNLEKRINSLETTNMQLREEILVEGRNKIIEAENRLRDNLAQEAASRAQALVDLQENLERETASRNQSINTLEVRFAKLENLPTSDDEFYHHFEEKFRGSREEIVNRLSVYVSVVKEHLHDWSQARFIDIGSGRGEWMDILKANGAVDYVGVDLNARQNAIAESFGHKTVCGDCIEYLAEQPDNSVDLISGIQIMEHLCMSELMELLKESHRVLKKGGMILFETPNPRNVVVGAGTFYTDPSHKRPLEPGMVGFMAEWSGFKNIRCVDANAHPLWEGLPLPEPNSENYELVKQFNDVKWLLYGPMDYTLFAVKE